MPTPEIEVLPEIGENRNESSQNKAESTRETGPRQAAINVKSNLMNRNKTEESASDLVEIDNAKTGSSTSIGKTAIAKGKKGIKKPAAISKKVTNIGKKGVDKETSTSNKGKATAIKKLGKKVADDDHTEDDKAATSTQTKGKKAPKVKKPKCVEECLPGPKSGCCLKSRKRSPGQLSCVEVFDLLKKLGVEDFSNLSKCLLSGLMSGCIEVPEGADLDTTMFEFKGIHCEHKVIVTMRKLLYQRDYGGDDYEDNGERATVWCESHGEGEDDCELGRYYVTSLCEGRPSLDSGKFHNHCDGCPGFGRCLGDYRCHCKVDKATGRHMKQVLFGSWDEDDNDGYDDSGDERVARIGEECSIS